jgi:2-polyprenyl-3-methyl-5-hydroxy-6-metoxy-1,4-benzoquinol methylase
MTPDLLVKPRRRFHQSDYARLERDRYDTIEAPLLLAALDDVVILKGRILEPACGQGHMAAELRHRGFEVVASDIATVSNPLILLKNSNFCVDHNSEDRWQPRWKIP